MDHIFLSSSLLSFRSRTCTSPFHANLPYTHFYPSNVQRRVSMNNNVYLHSVWPDAIPEYSLSLCLGVIIATELLPAGRREEEEEQRNSREAVLYAVGFSRRIHSLPSSLATTQGPRDHEVAPHSFSAGKSFEMIFLFAFSIVLGIGMP